MRNRPFAFDATTKSARFHSFSYVLKTHQIKKTLSALSLRFLWMVHTSAPLQTSKAHISKTLTCPITMVIFLPTNTHECNNSNTHMLLHDSWSPSDSIWTCASNESNLTRVRTPLSVPYCNFSLQQLLRNSVRSLQIVVARPMGLFQTKQLRIRPSYNYNYSFVSVLISLYWPFK